MLNVSYFAEDRCPRVSQTVATDLSISIRPTFSLPLSLSLSFPDRSVFSSSLVLCDEAQSSLSQASPLFLIADYHLQSGVASYVH